MLIKLMMLSQNWLGGDGRQLLYNSALKADPVSSVASQGLVCPQKHFSREPRIPAKGNDKVIGMEIKSLLVCTEGDGMKK